MSWAIKQEIVTDPTPRHVLLVLANYAGADGEDAFPSVERLSKETGMSSRSVQRALRTLEESGLIALGNQKIAEAKGFPKNRTPTVYRMVFDMVFVENMGRHSVTSKNSGVTNETFRGDIDDIQGRHSVTQTIIEPSSNHHTPIVPAERGDDMDAVWSAYPSWRRGSRKPVEASLRSAIKRGAKVKDILDGIRRAVAFWPKTLKEPRSNFIPNLTTFLNQDRWTVTDEEMEASWRPASAPRHQSASDLAEQHAIRMIQRMGMNR